MNMVNCSSKSYYTTQYKKQCYTPPNWKEPIKKKPSSVSRVEEKQQETSQQKLENSPKTTVPIQREQMDGYASWYGPGFHGKLTANGEKYNQNMMTAAHKLLPMAAILIYYILSRASVFTPGV